MYRPQHGHACQHANHVPLEHAVPQPVPSIRLDCTSLTRVIATSRQYTPGRQLFVSGKPLSCCPSALYAMVQCPPQSRTTDAPLPYRQHALVYRPQNQPPWQIHASPHPTHYKPHPSKLHRPPPRQLCASLLPPHPPPRRRDGYPLGPRPALPPPSHHLRPRRHQLRPPATPLPPPHTLRPAPDPLPPPHTCPCLRPPPPEPPRHRRPL